MSLVPETNALDAKTHARKPARRWWLIPCGAWIAVVFFSSTTWAGLYCSQAFLWLYGLTIGKHVNSQQTYSSLYFIAQKSLHLILFFVLGAVLWQVFSLPPGRRLIAVVCSGLVVGASSETLQFFFPNHHPAIYDVLLNMLGALLGGGARLLHARRESTQNVPDD